MAVSVTMIESSTTHKVIEMNESFETFLNSFKKDAKGRFIGYIVGLRDDGVNFYAWVQNARMTGNDFSDFGVIQRSKCFASQEAATRWAYATAKQRIAKL